MVIINHNAQRPSIEKLNYHDGHNVIHVKNSYFDAYFLIAKVSDNQCVLFEITNNMSFTSMSEPVEVDWLNLDTNTISNYFVWLKDSIIEKVNCKITFDFYQIS